MSVLLLNNATRQKYMAGNDPWLCFWCESSTVSFCSLLWWEIPKQNATKIYILKCWIPCKICFSDAEHSLRYSGWPKVLYCIQKQCKWSRNTPVSSHGSLPMQELSPDSLQNHSGRKGLSIENQICDTIACFTCIWFSLVACRMPNNLVGIERMTCGTCQRYN